MFGVQVAAMLAKYEWVESQRHLFGKAHTDFDFAEHDPKKAAGGTAWLRGFLAEPYVTCFLLLCLLQCSTSPQAPQ